MESRFINAYDNKRIHYIYNKPNNKEFLFFIHGAGSNHSIYKPFFKAFKDHNFIAIDIRSHGYSQRSKPTFSRIIDDMLLIIRKEKINKITLIGNSLGASIALEFYKCYPRLVKNMILFTLFSKEYIRFSSIFHSFASSIHSFLRLFKSKRKLKFMDYHKYKKRPVWYYPYLDVRGSSSTFLFYLVKVLLEYKINLTCIKIPTLIIVARKDYITKNKLIINDINKNNNLEYKIINSNHVLLTREFDKAIKLVRGFLNK